MQKVLDLVDKGEASRLLEDLVLAPSVNPLGDTTAVGQAVGAHRRVVGGEPSFGAKGGATDGSYLYHKGGVPTHTTTRPAAGEGMR